MTEKLERIVTEKKINDFKTKQEFYDYLTETYTYINPKHFENKEEWQEYVCSVNWVHKISTKEEYRYQFIAIMAGVIISAATLAYKSLP